MKSEDETSWMRLLYSCKYYKVWKGDLIGGKTGAEVGAENDSEACTKSETIPAPEYFLIGSVLSGEASLDGETFRKGDHFIIPAGYGPVEVSGEAEFIFSAPAK